MDNARRGPAAKWKYDTASKSADNATYLQDYETTHLSQGASSRLSVFLGARFLGAV